MFAAKKTLGNCEVESVDSIVVYLDLTESRIILAC